MPLTPSAKANVEARAMVLKIDMCDEDTIQRAARFLGVSYRTYGPYAANRKQWWRVKKQGALKSDLLKLIMRMKPHLCQRRQEQIDNAIDSLRQSQCGSTSPCP